MTCFQTTHFDGPEVLCVLPPPVSLRHRLLTEIEFDSVDGCARSHTEMERWLMVGALGKSNENRRRTAEQA